MIQSAQLGTDDMTVFLIAFEWAKTMKQCANVEDKSPNNEDMSSYTMSPLMTTFIKCYLV